MFRTGEREIVLTKVYCEPPWRIVLIDGPLYGISTGFRVARAGNTTKPGAANPIDPRPPMW